MRTAWFLIAVLPLSPGFRGPLPPRVVVQGIAADTVVRMAGAPVHPGVATLLEEVSIGVSDGAEEYMLGEVADIALGRDGSVYVLDRQVPGVRHYDASGRFLRTIGRSGSGPGEFRAMSGIATMGDGRLLLWDTGNWRLNVYAANGDFLTQWVTPSGSSGSSTAGFSRAVLVDTAGRIVTRKTIVDARDIMNRPTVWIRYRNDGRVLDTLHAPAARETPPLSATSGRAAVRMGVPFAPQRFFSMSPLGYLVAGLPDRYAFEIHQPGRAVLSVRRDVQPATVSRAERSREQRRVEDRMHQTDPTWSWNGPAIPETKPLYEGLEVGLDGRIWVALVKEVSPRVGSMRSGGVGMPGATPPAPRSSEADQPRPALYDVFEPDGRYLGQVGVPPKVSSVVRRGDQIWAVAYDADDVPRIKRYRIAWGK